MKYPMDFNRKFFLDNTIVPKEAVIEYLMEGNSKEDLVEQLLERMSLPELQSLFCEVRDHQEDERLLGEEDDDDAEEELRAFQEQQGRCVGYHNTAIEEA